MPVGQCLILSIVAFAHDVKIWGRAEVSLTVISSACNTAWHFFIYYFFLKYKLSEASRNSRI